MVPRRDIEHTVVLQGERARGSAEQLGTIPYGLAFKTKIWCTRLRRDRNGCNLKWRDLPFRSDLRLTRTQRHDV